MVNTPFTTIIALVQDRPGVLNRVTSLIRRRNFNISSLAVGPSETRGLSRMTFVTEADSRTLEQVTQQLRKLVDVVKVYQVDDANSISRELLLFRVSSTIENRSSIIQIANIFRTNIVDVAHDSMIIEVTGDETKLDSLLELLKPFGITDISRSGRLAINRGSLDTPEFSPVQTPRRTRTRKKSNIQDELGW